MVYQEIQARRKERERKQLKESFSRIANKYHITKETSMTKAKKQEAKGPSVREMRQQARAKNIKWAIMMTKDELIEVLKSDVTKAAIEKVQAVVYARYKKYNHITK